MKIISDTPYRIKGHIERSGFKFDIHNCYYIDGIWHRPVVPDDSGETHSHRQPEKYETGFDYIPFADDAIIDSIDKEEENDEL